MGTGAALNGGGVSTYVADISNAQEVVTTNSGGLGEAEVGGPAMNIVPKSGGNTHQGPDLPLRRAVELRGQQLHARNCETAGLVDARRVAQAVGRNLRRRRTDQEGSVVVLRAPIATKASTGSIPGIFPNLNAGDPTKWEYAPDTTPAGARRGKLSAGERAPDRAGHAAEQGQLPLGCAVAVQRLLVHGRRRRVPRAVENDAFYRIARASAV